MRSSNKARTSPGRGDARSVALAALLAWEDGRCELVGEAVEQAGLSGPDAGLARELALGAVTWARLYDHVADRFLKPGRQPAVLRATLRLIAHQLFALDRIPAHAALDATIEALRQQGGKQLTGVANAVGRRLSELRLENRLGEGPLGRLPETHIPTQLGIRFSLPDLLVDDLRKAVPEDELVARLEALNHLPPLCTRTRGVAPLIGRSILRQEGAWTWWDDPAEALALVADGRCVVQDRAQGEVAELTRARPGEFVLDLCAAPGGKSRALIDRGALVIAGDSASAKVREMAGEFPVLVQDAAYPAFAENSFPIVVLDAPCSNTGVLARRPEARWRYDKQHLGSLERLQRTLLRSAATLVEPGGRLVYSTCSLSPRENQGITHQLDGWRILAERVSWPDAWQLGGYACVLVRSVQGSILS